MTDDSVSYVPRHEILSFEEIAQVVELAVELGVTKVRLTGGEPLLRRNLADLVARLTGIAGLTDLALTTNGVLLDGQAVALRSAGLRRLNVHLDTLDPRRFAVITRRDLWHRVWRGLTLCRTLDFEEIKLNAVVQRGVNEPDILPLAELARDGGLAVRFIEVMPLDGHDAWQPGHVLSAAEILATIAAKFGPLHPVATADPHAPATTFGFADGPGTVGVIPTVTAPFCGLCNRLRLTAEGQLRNCLFATGETDLRGIVRDTTLTPAQRRRALIAAFEASVAAKAAGHGIGQPGFVAPPRPMHAIGG